MTPLQAISASTKTGAEVLGLASDVGTVEPGKVGDLIVVDGNPLADVEVLSRVSVVVQRGRVVHPR